MAKSKNIKAHYGRGAAFGLISQRNRVHSDKKKKAAKNACRKKPQG